MSDLESVATYAVMGKFKFSQSKAEQAIGDYMNAHKSLFKDVTKDPDTVLMKNISKVFQYIEKQAVTKKPDLSFNEIKAIHKEVAKAPVKKASIKLKQKSLVTKKIPINLKVVVTEPKKKIPINLKVVKPITKKKVTEGHLQITHVDFRYQMYTSTKLFQINPSSKTAQTIWM
jgi:hypothetical protein